jgi:prepilin-type processing-associated H-X9-DG protein
VDTDTAQGSQYWSTVLISYTANKWTNGLFRCPAYKGLTLDGNEIGIPLGSYGYNACGTKFLDSTLGLGGLTSKVDPGFEDLGNNPDFAMVEVRIPESQVKVPSDMIAIGDATLSYITASSLDTYFSMEGKSGFSGQGFLDINYYRFQSSPAYAMSQEFSQLMSQRHDGRQNVTFCDGHVESLKLDKLYEKSEVALRRWNNDHEPHANFLVK